MAEDFSKATGAEILSELGEGGCQNPKHVPVFINGMPSGCASISYFDDYYNPGFGGGGPTINMPSFESVWGELPEGATTWQIGDFDGDGVREVYAIDADGNPHTVYGYDDSGNVTSSPYRGETEDTDTGTGEDGLGELDQTTSKEDLRKILRDNGYSDEAIDIIFDAEVNSTTGSGLFQGNNVLSNALCEIGYSNCSYWSVKPIDVTGPAIGSGCTDANQREGVIDENGDCQFTAGGQCMKGSVPGTTDASGECVTDDGTGDGTGGYSEEEQSTAEAIKDWIEGKIGEVKDMTVDDVLEVVFGGNAFDPKCELTGEGEEMWDCTGTDGTEGNQCWKDCVSVNVLGGIPGLPMPPGAVDIGTVRDLENTAKEIGTTIGGILNPDPDDEGFIEKVKGWVIGKIEDIFGDIDDVTLEDITGWITGTLGNVLGGLILIETEDAKNTIIEKIDDILLGVTPDDKEDEEDDTTIDYGMCDDGLTLKLDEDGTNCSGVEPINNIGDFCTTGNGKDGTYQDIDGELMCVSGTTDDEDDVDDVDDDTPAEDDINRYCEEGVSLQPGATYSARKTAWDKACGQTHCFQGVNQPATKKSDHVGNDCNAPLKTDGDGDGDGDSGCPEGTVKCPEGTFNINDGSSCSSNPETECKKRGDDTDPTPPPPDEYVCEGDPQTAEQAQACIEQGWSQCGDNTQTPGRWFPSSVGEEKACGTTEPPPPPLEKCNDPDAVNNGENGPCECKPGYSKNTEGMCVQTGEVCDNGATIESGCDTCPDGSSVFEYEDGKCPSQPPPPPPPEECKNGAIDYPACKTCPEGQSIDENGKCKKTVTPPPPTPPAPPEDGDDGDDGGAGGGGGGMFRPQAVQYAMTGDPQLLAATQFPIVDYLSESLAKQTKNQLMTGMLTGNIV